MYFISKFNAPNAESEERVFLFHAIRSNRKLVFPRYARVAETEIMKVFV